MDLSHSFAVPTSLDATWAHFQDIGALAECFPGAQVTAVGADDDGAPTFEGTCKVKLGPIALVYAGAGKFVERDEAAHRFVVEAKGRDKRGNGTAGATVTVAMQPDGESTRVDVVTDLAITGKPAQFGRGVMQDVSDKLLGQFVSCLEQRLAGDADQEPDQEPDPAIDQDAGPASVPTGAAAVDPPPGDPDAGPASAPADPVAAGGDPPAAAAPPRPATPPRAAPAPEDDALDLGAAVVPILLKTYGRQIAVGLAALLGLVAVLRRLRR